jgi:hypothetical protein
VSPRLTVRQCRGTERRNRNQSQHTTLHPIPCRAAFNDDGVVSSQDFFDFITAFFALNESADFNGDGAVNSQDVFDFITAFFAGC